MGIGGVRYLRKCLTDDDTGGLKWQTAPRTAGTCFAAWRRALASRLDGEVMYQPDHFRADDVAQMHTLMRARPFATLVSSGSLGLYASHLPTVLKDEGAFGTIECHLARANPHCQDLAGGEALMIFQGAEGYITPNWYPSKFQHGKVVPTWNY